MSNRITRRQFAGTVATGALLATWQTARAQSGFLQWMERWNERVERFMFGADRLAAELPPSETTPAEAFPSYFISDAMPVAPAGWVLKVGGLVARPTTFSLAQLQQMPRTDMRVRHVADVVGADPRAPYVEFRSFDAGYWSSWDRESALHPQTLLAYGMNHA